MIGVKLVAAERCEVTELSLRLETLGSDSFLAQSGEVRNLAAMLSSTPRTSLTLDCTNN